jgi:hypothetical protein
MELVVDISPEFVINSEKQFGSVNPTTITGATTPLNRNIMF